MVSALRISHEEATLKKDIDQWLWVPDPSNQLPIPIIGFRNIMRGQGTGSLKSMRSRIGETCLLV
jgi:hypothetical protein